LLFSSLSSLEQILDDGDIDRYPSIRKIFIIPRAIRRYISSSLV